MKNKPINPDNVRMLIDTGHSEYLDYVQRMPAKDWKQILLAYEDNITFKAKIYKLVAKNLGHGVVEVRKSVIGKI